MSVRAVIQARMSSTRLRGKTLMPLAGKALLQRVVAMVKSNAFIDEVCVVTSSESSDDPIEAYCQYLKIPCFRGSKLNVFQRFKMVADQMNLGDQIIRVTADNPFCKVAAATHLFEQHIQTKADYSCVDGLSHIVYEIVNVDAFRTIAERGLKLSQYEQEHVTPVFRTKENGFKRNILKPDILNLKPELDKLLTIDTPADLLRVEELIEALDMDERGINFEEIYSWLRKNVEL